MAEVLRVVRSMTAGRLDAVTVGCSTLDAYLEFVAARGRPNTLLAVAYDLKGNRSGTRQAAWGGIQGLLLKSWVRASMAGMSCLRVVER